MPALTNIFGHDVNIGREVADVFDWAVDWLTVNMSWFFDAISDYLKVALGLLRDFIITVATPGNPDLRPPNGQGL